MTNISVLENKLSSVKKYLQILEEYKKYSQEEIENDISIRGAVERYLYLAIQASIDLSEAFISYKKMRKPATLSESFHILKENKIISEEFCQSLVKMTGFRNAIAYDYTELDYSIVYDVLKRRLKEIEDFIDIIENKI